MIRRPPRSTRTDTLFPYTTLFRSAPSAGIPSARLWPGIFSGRRGPPADPATLISPLKEAGMTDRRKIALLPRPPYDRPALAYDMKASTVFHDDDRQKPTHSRSTRAQPIRDPHWRGQE